MSNPVLCKHCDREIYKGVDSWYHVSSCVILCRPRGLPTTKAEPKDEGMVYKPGPGVAVFKERDEFPFFHFTDGSQCFELFQWINKRSPKPYSGYQWSIVEFGKFAITLYTNNVSRTIYRNSVVLFGPELKVWTEDEFYEIYERV